MTPVGSVVVFIIVWWTVIFMVLPFGSIPPEKPETGHDRGAPATVNLRKKLIITTIITIIIWVIIEIIFKLGWIDLRG